jgi:thioredoxin reductase (NADPH)
MNSPDLWEACIIGGGLAGLSAAVYLGRALRRAVVIDDGQSLALWEPEVQNYLGFPDGIAGDELLRRGRSQAKRYGISFVTDRIVEAKREGDVFILKGRSHAYSARRLLLATGLYHLPPDIPGVDECLGHSMFFCKDCDAYRVQGRRIAIIGRNNEAVHYALAMLLYSPCVVIARNGQAQTWDAQHARWIEEYQIPVFEERIIHVEHERGKVRSLAFEGGNCFAVDSIFTTRGDIYHNTIAQGLEARLDSEGQIVVNEDMLTSVPGLYAAGCVTPANCQMIIAAGQGATAAQAISRGLFEESLRNHQLRRARIDQLHNHRTFPETVGKPHTE